MRKQLSWLLVAVAFVVVASAVAQDVAPGDLAQRVRVLETENAALRKQVVSLNKEVAELKRENETLKTTLPAEPNAAAPARPKREKLPDQDCGRELRAKSLQIERGDNLMNVTGVIALSPKLKDKFVKLSYGQLKMSLYDAGNTLIGAHSFSVGESFTERPAQFNATIHIEPDRVAAIAIEAVETEFASTMSARVVGGR